MKASKINTLPPGRVLVFAPHADDESIGCGGAIIFHAKRGDPVKVIVVTDGAKGDSSGVITRLIECSYVELRRNEACKAARVLGVEDFEFWDYPDKGLKVSRDFEHRVLDVLDKYRPDYLYVPSLFEIHPDHLACCEMVCSALTRSIHKTTLLMYEIIVPLIPNFFTNITKLMDIKLKAIKCYKSQLFYNDYVSKISTLNHCRAELFEREIIHVEAFLKLRKEQVADVTGTIGRILQEISRE